MLFPSEQETSVESAGVKDQAAPHGVCALLLVLFVYAANCSAYIRPGGNAANNGGRGNEGGACDRLPFWGL